MSGPDHGWVSMTEAANIRPIFAKVCAVAHITLGLEHQLNRLRSGAIVLDEQYAPGLGRRDDGREALLRRSVKIS